MNQGSAFVVIAFCRKTGVRRMKSESKNYNPYLIWFLALKTQCGCILPGKEYRTAMGG